MCYAELLLTQNKVMNLTAITDPLDVASLHFLDSAALLCAADFKKASVIDVGTGAGFPGLPLRILEPSVSLTLLDSLGKRVYWLESVYTALSLTGVRCLHARAEEAGVLPRYRAQFDIATSRAVAPLPLLCELCLPFVKIGGQFLAMKSTDCAEEVAQAEHAVTLLGGRISPYFDYPVYGTDIVHRVVIIDKIAATPDAYPRKWNKIQKIPI